MTPGGQWYKIYCEQCGWKKDCQEDYFRQLREVKAQPLQGHIPQWDEEKQKIVEFPWIKRTRRFKCPKCGRPVFPKKMADVQGALDERADLEARSQKSREKSWAERDKDRAEGLQVPGEPPLRDEDGTDGVPPESDV